MDERFFLRFCSTARFFFASPGGFVDPGADVGSAGGGSDTGVAVDEGGDAGEAEVEQIESDVSPEKTTEDETLADETEESEGSAEKVTDPRKAITKELDKLRESNPEGAKLLRKAFFKQEQTISGFTRAFKTPVEAIEARDLIESYGGAEGITELKGNSEAYGEEMRMFAQGNPQAIDNFARDFPKGLIKLTPLAVDKMYQLDHSPTSDFARLASRLTSQTLQEYGVSGTLERLFEVITDGGPNAQSKAADLAKKLVEWSTGVKRFADSRPENQKDPRDEELSQREQRLQTEEQKQFYGNVGRAVTRRMNESISSHLSPYLKDIVKRGRPLSTEQKQGLASGIYTRISDSLKVDNKYQERLKGLLGAGDIGKIERFVAAQVDLRVAKAVRSEWHARGFAGPIKRTSQQNGAGSAELSTTKPNYADIDWTKDPRKLRYTGDGINGEYTDKKGRVHRFKH